MGSTVATRIARFLLVVGKDKRVWTGIGSVIAAVSLPFILGILCAMNIAVGGSEHNKAAVYLSFDGGEIPESMPQEYRDYVTQMQECFADLDLVMNEVDTMAEGENVDRYFVKAVFYSLFFGEARLRLDEDECIKFTECFFEYEERVREIEMEDGSRKEETYLATVPIREKVLIFRKLADHYGVSVTHEQQSNAVNVWYLAKYRKTAPLEGDSFEDWNGWQMASGVPVFSLEASEAGNLVVEAAKSRLDDPYSQTYRGRGEYVDCSYLALWCYRQAGISLPGTAAEQGRYLVENNLTIAKEDLQPGDLVFWSHKPNGRFMNITHVAVYAGKGKIIDASSNKGKVVYRNMFDDDKQVLYGRPLKP